MVNLIQITKGTVTTALDSITATTTSGVIECRNYNAVIIDATIGAGATYKLDIQGSNTANGTFHDIYSANNATQLTSGNLTASRMMVFAGVPDYIKIVATEVGGASTCTVIVQPIIM